MMNQAIAVTDQAIYVILLLVGLATCFWGYRVFRIWLFLAGLQAGFLLGLWLGGLVFNSQLIILIVAALLGLALALLSGLIIRIGGFLAGAGILVILAWSVLQIMQVSSSIRLYVLIGAVVLGGLLGVLSVKPFLILLTAINGAFLVTDSLFNLISRQPASQFLVIHNQLDTLTLVLLLVGTLVLATLGAIIQFRAARRKKGEAIPPKAAAGGTPSETPPTQAPPPANGQ